MSLPWFRTYTRLIDDEKLKLLAFEDRWHFMAILCCKGQGILDNPGELMRRKVSVKLGLAVRELDEVARRLSEVGLIDADTLQPLAWDKLQFVSDSDPTRNERQARYRERVKRTDNALRNGPVARTDTDSETETYSYPEQKEIRHPKTKNSGSDPEPSAKPSKRPPTLKRPDDVSEDTWMAFSALRKAKKAPLSGIALDRIRAEAGKAKITMDEALQTCCMRGWTGFKADWMHEDRGGGQRVNGNTAPNSYVGLSQKDYGKTRMGGFLERQMKAKLNGGDK